MGQVMFEDGWEFYQYSKHYKEIRLKKGNETKTLKIAGWMPDFIAEVKHEAQEEFKRELKHLLGIIHG